MTYFDGKRNRYPEVGTQKKLRESVIESWSCGVASACGWLTRKFKTPSRRASPDRMFFKLNPATLLGYLFFVEFKAPGEIPTPAQYAEHDVYRKQGFKVYVVDGKQSFLDVFVPEDQALLGPPDPDWL